MIPIRELEKIRIAANAYVTLAESDMKEFSWLGSLDDKCQFDGEEYTIRQLLGWLSDRSTSGVKFARAVYDFAQKNPILDEMIETVKF